jgi:hypothetical protein
VYFVIFIYVIWCLLTKRAVGHMSAGIQSVYSRMRLMFVVLDKDKEKYGGGETLMTLAEVNVCVLTCVLTCVLDE